MTLENKERLKQLGWGKKVSRDNGYEGRVRREERRAAKAEARLLRLEKELVDVKDWLERLAARYRGAGYDARPIDAAVERIKVALK